MKRLDELSIGESGVVHSLTASGRIKRRLLDMGITVNSKITLKKKAPLGDPLEVFVKGYELTLRKQEASFVLIKTEENL